MLVYLAVCTWDSQDQVRAIDQDKLLTICRTLKGKTLSNAFWDNSRRVRVDYEEVQRLTSGFFDWNNPDECAAEILLTAKEGNL